MRARIIIAGLALVAVTAAVWPWVSQKVRAQDVCAANYPGGAAPAVDPDRQRSGRVICYSAFVVFHSGITKTPLWSAEHLTADRLTRAKGLQRRNSFHAEPLLPTDERSELRDYARSGFDRGHMSPSGDMPDEQSQHESFSLANMIPQNPCNNEELWEGIESTVRDWALQRGDLFVVTGPIFPRGTKFQQIGDGVLIPPQIFKAVYDPATGQAGVYVTANADSPDWQMGSLDWIHATTGVDPFPAVAAAVKAATMQLPPPKLPHFHCHR